MLKLIMDCALLDFVNKYFGVANTGNTPQNKGQCVGLVSVYMDSLGIAHEWGNAKDLLENADLNKFEVIYNDPDNYDQYPKPGNIMVLGKTWGNGFGHTGVVLRANGYSFSLFDQNNPAGHTPTITNFPNYAGVSGWLNPKV